jgi:hypothetical protein
VSSGKVKIKSSQMGIGIVSAADISHSFFIKSKIKNKEKDSFY